MEIDFEEILISNLQQANGCLDDVVGYSVRINLERLIEAKAIIGQTLNLISLKNSKLNSCKNNGNHTIDPNSR